MYGGRGFDSGGTAPVKVGDELEMTIEAVGAKGDGIAKKEGFVIFVPGVQKGDNVKVRITRVLRKVGFGEVVGQSDSQPEDTSEAEEPAEAEEEQPQEQEEAPQEDSEDFGEEGKQ